MVRVMLNLFQFFDACGVNHFCKFAVLLGYPQTDIGASRNQLRIGPLFAQLQQAF